jgi:hypothetical protein
LWDNFEVTETEIRVNVPDTQCSTIAQRKGRSSVVQHEFTFSHVFGQNTLQEEIFDTAAKGIVQGL